MGYHVKKINKGVLGETSKIREELEELEDSLEQGNRIMALLEMSDIYGALEALVRSFGLEMEDLKIMSEATIRSFISGERS
jgi:hypothetical protein